MSGIAKCPGVGCPLKEKCKRFRIEPSYNQAWHGYDMLRIEGDPSPECFKEYVEPAKQDAGNPADK